MSFPTLASKALVCSYARKAVPPLVVAMAFFLVCLPLFSQGSQGTIQGGVFDQSGGAVSGSMVTVIDVARGVTRNLVTDDTGQYVASGLTPGTYTVRATAKGFRTEEHSSVLVEVGQNTRVDLTLSPGEQTQTITVTGEAPSVDTTDATLGGAVSNQSIVALPLNGRNFQRLLQLRPGVLTPIGASSGGTSTNGRRGGDDSFVVEGITQMGQQGTTSGILNSSYRGGDSASILPIDAIQEFNTEQNPKAEFGWRTGSVVNVGIRSGTNSIHGTAYAFGRDASATDAGNYFSTPGTPAVTPATLEQFGATAGGRILKDKLFWFASYEGLRDNVGDTAALSIPSDVPGLGIASSMIDACNALAKNGGGFNPVGTPGGVNPLSAQLAGITINPVTGCAVSPSNSTLTSAIENVFPFNPNNSTAYSPSSQGVTSLGPLNNGLFKGDYIPGPHHHISGFYFIARSNQILNSSSGQLLPLWEVNVYNDVQAYGGNWAWTPSSTWVNEFRGGYAFLHGSTTAADVGRLASAPYPGGYSMPTGVTNPLFGGFPYIKIQGFSGFLGDGPRQSRRGPEGDADFVDSVSYLRGSHAFKFGFEFLDNVFDEDIYTLGLGMAQFSKAGAITGLESFLLGNPNNGTILIGDPTQIIRNHWFAGFVQDDWRISRRVTLNLGLRYEYQKAPTDRFNYMGNFDPTVNPATTPGVQQAGPGAPLPRLFKPDPLGFSPRLGVAWDVRGDGKTVVRAGASVMRTAITDDGLGNFSPFGANIPSIGFNTSGTAVNAHTPQTLPISAGQFNWNTAANLAPGVSVFPGNASLTTTGQFAGTYTGLTCTYPGEAGLPANYTPTQCGVWAVAPYLKLPGVAEWNLDIQRAISNNLTVDLAYVGNHGFNEMIPLDQNQAPIGTGWNTPFTPAQFAYANAAGAKLPAADLGLTSAQICIATGGSKCVSNALAEIQAAPYFSKFPYYASITTYQNGDFSYYNALQITVSQRAFHGLSFLAGYTYAHALDIYSVRTTNAAAIAPPGTPLSAIYGNSDNDIRHRFTFAPTFLIPGIKSPGQMLQGWSLSGIWVMQGGQPWYPIDQTSNDLLGTGEYLNQTDTTGALQPWNYSGPPSAFKAGKTSIPCYGNMSGCTAFASAPAAIQTACNNAATAPYGGATTPNGQLALAALNNFGCYVQGGGVLTPPAFGTMGNASRNMFRSQPYYNVDLSVAKIWRLKERYSAEFRMEFFNIFNRTDFASPAAGSAATDPSTGSPAGATGLGYTFATPDAANPVLGSGGPRHIQFGLKLAF
jgi:hypothetical protein